jgi:hypothetical protein
MKRNYPKIYNVPLLDRIATQTFYSPDGCWYWTGHINENRRAKIGIAGVSKYVSRVIYELVKGPIPDKLLVCHTCDNPVCINPDHLFLGTHSDNSIDMVKKGRCRAAFGTKSGKSKLTDIQVLEMRSLKGKMTLEELGERFGVTGENVWSILRGDTWKHLL